jgi:hypothetical protein
MESTSKDTASGISDFEKQLIERHLGIDGVIIDPNFKGTHILKETQARRRAELVEDIEYVYSLALKQGDYYLGQAEIHFTLTALPASDSELFIDS